MKEISLTKGKVALVDDEIYPFLIHWKWSVVYCKKSKNFYAKRLSYIKGRNNPIHISMHRFILGLTDKDLIVDHKDFDGLNNQIENLRVCSKSENNRHTKSRKNSTSKFLGVCYVVKKKRIFSKKQNKILEYTSKIWVAAININGKVKHIGCFKSEEDAARAYDLKAKENYGEFANLNFK